MDREALELRLQEYRSMIGQIKVFFNENDMDRLVSGFLKVEEDNYNLFSFINELNKEVGDVNFLVFLGERVTVSSLKDGRAEGKTVRGKRQN